jgi:hypothetical protein
MTRLLRYFSIASLITVVLATVILSALYRHIATSQLLELGENNNVALAQIFANSIWPQYRSFVDAAGRVDADRLRAHPSTAELHKSVLGMMRNTHVVKVKLYENEGRTMFSTDPKQIGKDYSANPGFISARKGQPASELTHRDKFSAFDREIENRDVISSYVPLRAGSEAPIEGVLEIYTDVTDLLASVDRQERLVILSVVAVLTVLYSALFFIARHADVIFRAQSKTVSGTISGKSGTDPNFR